MVQLRRGAAGGPGLRMPKISFGNARPSVFGRVLNEARNIRSNFEGMRRAQAGQSREEQEFWRQVKDSKERQKMAEFESTMKLGSKENYGQMSQKAMMTEAREKIRMVFGSLGLKSNTRATAVFLENQLIKKLGLELVSQVDANLLGDVFAKSANLRVVISRLNSTGMVSETEMNHAVGEIQRLLQQAAEEE